MHQMCLLQLASCKLSALGGQVHRDSGQVHLDLGQVQLDFGQVQSGECTGECSGMETALENVVQNLLGHVMQNVSGVLLESPCLPHRRLSCREALLKGGSRNSSLSSRKSKAPQGHNRVRPLAAGTTSAPSHAVENVVSVVENALENVVECVLANVL